LAKDAWFPPPVAKRELLQRGAVEEGFEEVWKRAPNLRKRLLDEYEAAGTPVYSYAGAALALI
jgi:hypothetical protein